MWNRLADATIYGTILISLSLLSCGPATPTPAPTLVPTPLPEKLDLWEDSTETLIGITDNCTNKVELADVNGDGRVGDLPHLEQAEAILEEIGAALDLGVAREALATLTVRKAERRGREGEITG